MRKGENTLKSSEMLVAWIGTRLQGFFFMIQLLWKQTTKDNQNLLPLLLLSSTKIISLSRWAGVRSIAEWIERRITERASLTNMNTMLTSGSLSGNVRFLHLKKNVKTKQNKKIKNNSDVNFGSHNINMNCFREIYPLVKQMSFVDSDHKIPVPAQSTDRQEGD